MVQSIKQNVGDAGIAAQIIGDGNTVTITRGTSSLILIRKHARRDKPATELQLLRVDLRSTTLLGREIELADLQSWLGLENPVSVRCLTARAGTGKTRLALELCERAEMHGWCAGFIDHEQFREFARGPHGWACTQPTLVVIDYAAALGVEARSWLEHLARPETQSQIKKLRVLLLERHADANVGWWAELLRTSSFSEPNVAELAHPQEPVPVRPLDAITDRRTLLREAMESAAQIAGVHPVPQLPATGEDPEFDFRIGDDSINNEPLYLMMAGVQAVHTSAPTALALSAGKLAECAASRERQRLIRLGTEWGSPEKLIPHLASCVTLEDGTDTAGALRIVTDEIQAMQFAGTTLQPLETALRLRDALKLPGIAGLDAIRPDIIGEAFLLLTLSEYEVYPQIQRGIIERAWHRAGKKVTTVLIRVAQDYAEAPTEHRSIEWLRGLIEQIEGVDSLAELAGQFPEHSTALREVALLAQQRTINALKKRNPIEPRLLVRLAVASNNLANRFWDLNKRQHALGAAQESVELSRQLVKLNPQFNVYLAMALNVLGIALRNLDRHEEAFKPAAESVSLYRKVVGLPAREIMHRLGISLYNLSNVLTSLGDDPGALVKIEEAVELGRRLTAIDFHAFSPSLALWLNKYSIALSVTGRAGEALITAEDVAKRYQFLAARLPDSFNPLLSTALNNLSLRLRELKLFDRALFAIRQAVAIRSKLAERKPDVFRAELADSLDNLAAILTDLNEWNEALKITEEVIQIRRELVASLPEVHSVELCVSLGNLAAMRRRNGQINAAVLAAGEAVSISRQMRDKRPTLHSRLLAKSLMLLANSLCETPSRTGAVNAGQESAQIYSTLLSEASDELITEYARSLVTFARCYYVAGFRIKACSVIEKAIGTLFPIFLRSPGGVDTWMRSFLLTYRQWTSELGRAPKVEIFGPVLKIFNDRATSEEDVTMDASLITAAMAVLMPYVGISGQGAAKAIGQELATRVLNWMRDRLPGDAHAALAKFEEAPASELNQDNLKLELRKLLSNQPKLREELRNLLRDGHASGLQQNVAGGGKAIQTQGNNNTSSIA